MKRLSSHRFARMAGLIAGAGISIVCLPARADISFLGVAAGDASSNDAVLWTRAVDTNAPAVVALTAQVAPNDPTLSSGVITFSAATDPNKDYAAKVNATGLQPNTRYFYRFVSGAISSLVGTFKTAPEPTTAAPVRFAFSGDVDGLMRPYALTRDFNMLGLDFFAFLGDTIYETASANSPATASTGTLPAPSSAGATQAQLFADYSRKYREQFLAVNPGGQNCLQTLFAAQGNYTLFDNHELGNKQYINGGAPAGGPVGDMTSGAGVDARQAINDVNTSGSFMNKTPGFQALEQVYLNYQPVKNRGLLSTAGTDPRSDATPQLFFAQPWGKNMVFINTDDRSYRDIRSKTAGNADDTGPRAGNANRTILGTTQLAWLEQALLTAQNAGTMWKIVAISDPIDQLGPIGGGLNVTNGGNTGYAPVAADGGKSWMGGYRAERNGLLKFIADNHIDNVVFLATDDHQNRVNELLYSPAGQTEVQSSYVRVPHCFEIVCGPLGATGPDLVTNHTFANNKLIADSLASAQKAAGLDPVGLDPNYPGLHNVFREGDPQADSLRQPVDFYSPDTFNYNTLEVSADGKTLTVKSFGINSTAQNSFLEYDAANNPVREIFSFQVDAGGDALAAIDHIIFVYQENWSFDALYGSFPGANGFANASAASLTQLDRLTGAPLSSLSAYDPVSRAIPIQNPPVPLNGANVQDSRFLANPANTNGPLLGGLNTLLPYNLQPYLAPGDLTGDIVHRYWQEQFQIDGGRMDQFVTWSDNPGLVMSYFDASSMPEGLLARQYVMCDNFFHSAFGGSFLNHQFLVAAAAPVYPNAAGIVPSSIASLDANGFLALDTNGRIIRDGNITPIGGVVFANPSTMFDQNYAVNTIFSANLAASGNPSSTSLLPSLNDSNPADLTRPYLPTIGDLLNAANVSWKWYSGGWDRALNLSPSNPSHFGTTLNDPSISLFQWHHQAFAFFDNYAPWKNGVRNPVSAAHIQDEANFFQDVTNNTLPAVSFIKPLGPDNEHPGYASLQQGQQHVADIVAAVQSNPTLWAHTAIIVTYDEHGGRWDHVTPPARDIWGPGARVPGIIISPLSKSNYVDHTQYETLSILKTIEQRFGVPALNSRDASAASFAPAFNSALTAIPSSVAVTRGGYALDRRTQHYLQQVQLTNTGANPVPAPLLLALDNLSANATLFNPAGATVHLAPLGSPYVSVGTGGNNILSPGETATITLEFVNPTRGGINYNARALAGTPAP